VQFLPLFHLPHSDLRSDQYWSSRNRKPANAAYNLPLFHSHSMNVNRIAILDAGGERAPKTTQSAYSSCHDPIRTHTLNWGQSWGNRKMEPRSGYSPAKKPRVYVQSVEPTRQDRAVWVAWQLQAWPRAVGSVPTRTEAG